MAALYHQVWINASVETVYQAISTVDGISGWWEKQSAVETDDGTVLEHDPGPEHGPVRMRVFDLKPNKRIEWECISTHPKISPASAWTNTRIAFDISRLGVPPWSAHKVEMTVLDFHHSGWDETNRYFGFCNFAWAQALQKLKRVCESQQ